VDPDWVINGTHRFIRWGHFWFKNVWGPFSRLIRRTKHRLITGMDEKSQDKSIKPINPSLKIIYCSTTFSNRGIIRLIRFVLRL
jgi:hypothetical protein